MLDLGDPSRLQDEDGLFPRSVLRDLVELVDCDFIDFHVHNSYRRCDLPGVDLGSGEEDETSSPSEEERALDRFYWDHFWSFPLCSHPDRTGDYSTVITHSTFGRPRDFYAEFLSWVGIRHFLLIPLEPQGQIDYRILLRRSGGREFTERERLMLSVARPQIAKIHKALLRKRHDTEILLTERQKDLLRQVAAGLTNRQIARNLSISEATVRKHLENVYSRLEVPNRAGAVARAFPADVTP
ncbi:MAG TPA: LuxR C-terminal-related transcriptional regulator [Gemmatimonadales bacterium]|nr:LuxR C-terminal-related transcriptional regulator [Gemmatimonadales bacterium]